MRLILQRHPDTPCAAVEGIDAEASRLEAGALALRFTVMGRIDAVRVPPSAPSARTDELWRHTCFEAFVRPLTGEAYHELNFAPSTAWAAYRLAEYRAPLAPALDVGPPSLEIGLDRGQLVVAAAVTLPSLPAREPWRIGLSAVIEEADGRMSYWALAHPAGKPDFHHLDCFALELPAPERS
jgi:hypothetical protein